MLCFSLLITLDFFRQNQVCRTLTPTLNDHAEAKPKVDIPSPKTLDLNTRTCFTVDEFIICHMPKLQNEGEPVYLIPLQRVTMYPMKTTVPAVRNLPSERDHIRTQIQPQRPLNYIVQHTFPCRQDMLILHQTSIIHHVTTLHVVRLNRNSTSHSMAPSQNTIMH